MILKLEELMVKLGVRYNLSPYQTCPWSIYDEDKGVTCSAEVRMNPTGNLVEAELQVFYDEPPSDKPALDQVILIKASLHENNGKWQIDDSIIRGKSFINQTYAWDEKSCNFFRVCVQDIAIGEFPDIESYIKKELKKEKEGDRYGDGSSKSPIIRPEQLMDLGKGGSF